MFIFIAAAALIIGFRSEVHALIPLYSVGVFVSFTIAQYGMFKKWRIMKESGWQYKCWINGIGAIVTAVVSVYCILYEIQGWCLDFSDCASDSNAWNVLD